MVPTALELELKHAAGPISTITIIGVKLSANLECCVVLDAF